MLDDLHISKTKYNKSHHLSLNKAEVVEVHYLNLLKLLCVFKQSACETDSSPCGEKEICIPDYKENSARCICSEGYAGKPCSKYMLPYHLFHWS